MNQFVKLATAAAFTVSLSTAAFAATWEMPTPYPDATFHTVNIKEFASDVEKATGGKLKINVHSAGSLFKHKQIKNAVRGGQAPIGEFFMGLLANENPVYAMDTLPFLASDYPSAAKLWKVTRPAIDKAMAAQGLMVLFSVPWPPQGVYAKKEIKTATDMKGLKFRAYNASTTRLAELAGAVPTQIEVADLPQAFATGRVDAMITSPSTGVSTKAWDFLSYFHHTQAWIPKNVVVVNKAAFMALDDATRAAVKKAAMAAEKRGWEMSKAETDSKIAVMKEHGIKIITPSPELLASLKAIGATMSAEWAKKAGAEGASILAEYKK